MTTTITDVSAEKAPTRFYPTADHPNEMDPIDVPDVYASVCRGDCLHPVFPDGECLVFSKTEPVRSGDFVGIWLRPDIAGPDELPRRVKKLRMGLPDVFTLPIRMAPGSNVMPLIELEQLNPPRVYRFPADHIVAMHKVIGTAILNGDGTARMVAFDNAAEGVSDEK